MLHPFVFGTIASTGMEPQILWTPSDNDFDSPATLTDVWHDGDDAATFTAPGGAVSVWRDKIAGANHLNQPSGSKQPVTNSINLNGLNVVDFDGLKAMEYTAPWTSGTVNIFHMSLTNVGDSRSFYRLGSTDYIPMARTADTSTQLMRVSGASVVPDIYINGLLDTYANRGELFNAIATGAYQTSSLVDMPASTSTLEMGWGAGGWTMEGQIGESIIIAGTMTQSDIDKVNGYLAWKWDGGVSGALVTALPIGSPYKTEPPYV